MRYPAPLEPGSAIGVTAPSSGVEAPLHPRLEAAESHLRARGLRIREGRCLRESRSHVSASAADRIREFTAMWLDPDVAAIIPPWGGELLMEILPRLDFDRLRAAPPTWVMGYSDISTLLFPLTLRLDVATAHGTNLMEQVAGQTAPLARECLAPLHRRPGETVVQASSERFQTERFRYEDHPDRGFGADAPTRWRVLGSDPDSMRGRIIGGCVDTLVNLIGTPFGDLAAFRRRYDGDGLILFLENCELIPPHLARTLWQLRQAGWFEGLSGLVFGRTGAPESDSKIYSGLDAVRDAVAGLGCPVIVDADIGHVPPQMTILNGALADLAVAGGRATLTQTLA